MKFKCKINTIMRIDKTTAFNISSKDVNVAEEIEKMKYSNKDLICTIEYEKNKKSNNANNYMWELLKQVSEKLGCDNIELYKKYVKSYGIYRDTEIDNQSADTLIKSWSLNGIAWFADVLDFEDTKYKKVRLYYGTSVYNSKQMSRILNAIVTDCREIGIPTLEDLEIQKYIKEM